jgi:hypothetical protein
VHFPVTRLVLGSVASLVSIVLLVALAAVWRLSQGPVSVAFLIPYLQDAFTLGEGEVRASVRDAILTWGRDDDLLEIRAVDMALRSAQGETLAQVPDVSIHLSVPALMRGRVVPTEVDITGVQARVTRSLDGEFSLGFWSAPDSTDAAKPVEPQQASDSVVQALVRETQPGGSLAELRRIGIRNAAISLYDEESRALFQAPRSHLSLEREPGAVWARTRLDVEIDGRSVTIGAEGRYELATGAVSGAAVFTPLELAVLGKRFQVLSDLAGAAVPVSGRVRFAMGGDRRLGDLSIDAEIGAGQIAVKQLRQPVAVDSATFRGTVPGTFDRVAIEALSLKSDGLQLDAAGTVEFGRGLGLNLQGQLQNLPVDRLAALWPEDASRNARTWITANVRGGTVPLAKFQAKLSPEQIARNVFPADAFTLDFEVAGASIDYLRPMPRLTGVNATARLNTRLLDMTVRSGTAAGVTLSNGRVVVTGLHERDQVAEVRFDASGAVPAILGLVDQKPLELVRKVGVDPAKTGGTATLQTSLRVPLENKLRIEDLGVKTEAKISGFSMPGVRPGIDMAAGELTLLADTKHLEADGTAALNGQAVKLSWREQFEGGGQWPSRYELSGETTDEGRKALGYDTAPYLSGPVPVEAVILASARGAAQIDAKADLRRAIVKIDEAYWTKPAGDAARADVRAVFDPGRPALLDATLNAGPYAAQGRITLNDGRFTQARIDRLRLPLVEGAGSVERLSDESWALQFSGPRVDMTPFLDDVLGGPPGPKTGPAISVTLNFDHAVLADKVEVNNLRTSARVAKGDLRQLEVRSDIAPKGALRIDITPDGKHRKLAMDSTDAGLVLRFLGIGDTKGGAFQLAGDFLDDQAGEPLKARAVITDFTITDAPLLARLIAVGSLTGVANLLTGEGISFSRAEIPFTLTGDVLKLEGARARGSALGITAEGTVNTADKKLSISGSLVPVYFLNSLLGNIPLIGPLLESRKGEGVFGLTYRIRGAYENPDVLVNPVSLFAPGFLRRLFELSPGSPNEPAEPPPPPSDKDR